MPVGVLASSTSIRDYAAAADPPDSSDVARSKRCSRSRRESCDGCLYGRRQWCECAEEWSSGLGDDSGVRRWEDWLLAMVTNDAQRSRSRILGPLGEIGGRAAALALRPVTNTVGAAVEVGANLERRAVDRVLDSGELERVLTSALDSARLQAGVRGALASDGARQLVDSVFDSQLMERTLTSALDSARLQAGLRGALASNGARQLVDSVFDSQLVERILTSALDGARVQAGLRRALASDGARQLVDSVFDSGLFDQLMERTLTSALDGARVQAALRRALASDGARQLVDSFFDSGLFDQFMERLSASDALWQLIDEIATSPTVTAALSKQGLGFADQVGDLMRDRSRKADHRAERIADRLTRRRSKGAPSDGDGRSE